MRKLLPIALLLMLMNPISSAVANEAGWQNRFYFGASAGYARSLHKRGPAGGFTIGFLTPVGDASELGIQWNGEYGLDSDPLRYGFYTLAARWNYFFRGIPRGWLMSGLAGYANAESYPVRAQTTSGPVTEKDVKDGAFLGLGLGYRYPGFSSVNIPIETGAKFYSALYTNTSGLPMIASLYVNFLF